MRMYENYAYENYVHGTVRGPIKLPRFKLHFVEVSKMTLNKHREISPN